MSAEASLYHQNGDERFKTTLFVRGDSADGERSHGDLRELYWQHLADNWEMRLGIARVFWGATESVHRVDIVNQTDAVEAPDGEDKLGQPMLHFTYYLADSSLEFFLLPGFRERTFPGVEGRLRAERSVLDGADYRAGANRSQWDYALRWSGTWRDVDVGLSWFDGVNRTPRFEARNDGLVAIYEPLQQLGLDLQAPRGNWLWKLDAVYRHTPGEHYLSYTGGFEYTRAGIVGTSSDLGWLLEYSHDSRGDNSTEPYQRDLFAGVRWSFNDIAGSSLLLGISQDFQAGDSRYLTLEGERRWSDNWSLGLDLWLFESAGEADPFHPYTRDDFLQFTAEYHF
ncbi:hypothetical protein [Microbulbifer rhizosphaerae]|uniref:Alginate export domain-containing protein n=1 Tax=Microbulbifer rhizosphaerae TaxID=1562603 RepID=A0A7W4Z9U9_9GAMM|nr:hypothetical protein [Microbulbifer rhizosphaerae]MBB3061946.1 hypothetical protein [Microbulbifer rhizosphaerae]